MRTIVESVHRIVLSSKGTHDSTKHSECMPTTAATVTVITNVMSWGPLTLFTLAVSFPSSPYGSVSLLSLSTFHCILVNKAVGPRAAGNNHGDLGAGPHSQPGCSAPGTPPWLLPLVNRPESTGLSGCRWPREEVLNS